MNSYCKGENQVTTTGCNLFIYLFIYLFIPQQGFVADSFFIYNFMPLNHLVDRRSVGGALFVRGNLSGMTDDADRCNETLCYLDSLVQSVIEVPASFYYLSPQVKLVSLLGKMSLKYTKKKKKKLHQIKTSARRCVHSRLVSKSTRETEWLHGCGQ